MNELVAQNTELAHDIGFTDEVSWVAPPNLTMEQYLAISRTFQQIQQSIAYWYGDLLNTGEDLFGEEFAQAIPETGRSAETLLKYKATAARIPRDIRRPELSWTHSFYCAYILEAHRGPLLDLAANVGLSSRDLKEVVRLDDETRAALLMVVANYQEEEGPLDYDTFMRLLNRIKLDSIDKPERDDEDDDDDDEIDDEPDEDDDSDSEELKADDITDFWENQGVPLLSIGKNQAVWEGMVVYAAVNSAGNAVLIWEGTT